MTPPRLPPEIVAQIIKQATLRSDPPRRDTHPYHTHALATLCLISKSFYAHAARLLYSTIVVHSFSSTALLPLLDTLGAGVDPASWVRTLVILEDRIPRLLRHDQRAYTPEELENWQKLEDVVERMVNLETVIYEADHSSARLAAALEKLHGLRHLICGNMDDLRLWLPDGSLALPPLMLSSLTVYWLPRRSRQLQTLPALLHTSRATLRKLHVSTRLLDADADVPDVLATIFGGEPLGMRLDELILDTAGCTPAVATALVRAIDFSTISHLVLIGSPPADFLAAALLKMHTRLRTLRKLQLGGPASAFLSSFMGLQELQWTLEDDPVDIAAISTQHGETLRILTLDNFVAVRACQLEQLVGACRSLKDLSLTVDCTDFPSIATSLSSLLCLHTLTLSCVSTSLLLPDAPQHLHFAAPPHIWPPYADMAALYPFVRFLPDGLDAALGALLMRGVRAHDVQIEGLVLPYWGLWETVFISGRKDTRAKRWIVGDEELARRELQREDRLMGMAWRGGNVGDRYRCEGVGVVMVPPREREMATPVGRERVPPCCWGARRKCRR